MATVKATFTLDETTARKLALTSERLGKPKSAVVREAIAEYSERADRLSQAERRRMLRVLDEIGSRIPPRDPADLQAELDEIRAARRSGGRRTRVE